MVIRQIIHNDSCLRKKLTKLAFPDSICNSLHFYP